MTSIVQFFKSMFNLNHLIDVPEMVLIRMKMTARVSLICFLLGFILSAFFLSIGFVYQFTIGIINTIAYLAIAFVVYKKYFETSKLLFTLNTCWGVFEMASFVGKASSVHLYILLAPLFILSIYDLSQKRLIIFSITLYILTFLLFLTYDINPIFPKVEHPIFSERNLQFVYVANIILIIFLMTLLVAYILKINANFLNESLQKNKSLSSTEKMLNNEVIIRKEAEQRIQLMYEELQSSFDRLKHFNQMVSHNLRSPIANLIGLSQLVEDDSIEDEQKEVLLENIRLTATKLDDVIKDMNQILTINKDVNELKTEVDLETVFGNVVTSEQVKLAGIQSNIKIDFSKVNSIVTVSSFIHSIFHNLLSNAIKYRRPDAVLEIGVSSKLVNNVVIIEFADNGLGIDLSNNKHKIFKPYNRFHTEIEGKGIGLYLVQSQVQMLGGKISVSSKVGVGTTFIIELKK